MNETDRAAIATITVLNKTMMKDYVALIINDGNRRLLTKEKVYSFIVGIIPEFAPDVSEKLKYEKDFIIDVENKAMHDLVIDERSKKAEISEKLRADMRVTSPAVMREIGQQRIEKGLKKETLYGVAREMRAQDLAIEGYSRMGAPKKDDIHRR